jgi:hypothetical protein
VLRARITTLLVVTLTLRERITTKTSLPNLYKGEKVRYDKGQKMLVSSKADVTKPKKRTSLSYYALKAPIFYGP